KTARILVIVSLASCGAHKPNTAPAPDNTKGDWFSSHISLKGTTGAGFAGLLVAETVQEEAISKVPRCATCPDSVLRVVPDSVDLVGNYRRSWTPALSAGLTLELHAVSQPHLGGGIGAQMVFVPDQSGKTAPFPAFTLHLGDPDNEIFGGIILSPTDQVRVPGGRYRAARTSTLPNFVTSNTGYSSHIYVGFQIKGVRISGAELKPGVASMSFESATLTLHVNDTRRLALTIKDLQGNDVKDCAVSYESADTTKVVVDQNGTITAIALTTAPVVVTAQCQDKSASVSVTVN
ncbi:MAG TPA: Ig-like domain-containing protein, partial [Phototrophicaceae bacterium]|nr:Ig-like domain-containing protein [Phototrophicaceae bacterium]